MVTFFNPSWQLGPVLLLQAIMKVTMVFSVITILRSLKYDIFSYLTVAKVDSAPWLAATN